MTLKSRIVFIKEIQSGDAVSYGGTFVAEEVSP
ncbi:MAG: alanine racemase C-terminal domain-containing protein [Lachnospiraceae bacterium]